MKLKRDFNPVEITLETAKEVEMFKWLISSPKHTVRAESEEESKALLQFLEKNL